MQVIDKESQWCFHFYGKKETNGNGVLAKSHKKLCDFFLAEVLPPGDGNVPLQFLCAAGRRVLWNKSAQCCLSAGTVQENQTSELVTVSMKMNLSS